MDRSTSSECREISARFGTRVQTETGSPPIERFAGTQIRKFFKGNPDAYARTARIHLVSSYLCSLLIGADAPVDTGDGAGMGSRTGRGHAGGIRRVRSQHHAPVLSLDTAAMPKGMLPCVGRSAREWLSTPRLLKAVHRYGPAPCPADPRRAAPREAMDRR